MWNRRKWYSFLLVGLALLLAGSVIGCPAPAPTPTPTQPAAPLVIVAFSATPTQISAGESATLQWNVTGATTVNIDHGIGDVPSAGTKLVSPTTTTTYTLTATNAADRATDRVTLAVVSTLPKVTRVIDGDTIEVDIGGKLYKVRYIGIDTPETVHPSKPVECFGKEASEKNRQLVEGKTVRLEKDVSEIDSYGRLLRYVWVGDNFVNDYLVRQGYAYASTYPPDVKYADQFVQAQREARENNRGLWAVRQQTPEIRHFRALPSQINAGKSSTLFWWVENATTVTIDQGIGNVDHGIGDMPSAGTEVVSPGQTTTYTLKAINDAGTVTRSVVVTVRAPPPPKVYVGSIDSNVYHSPWCRYVKQIYPENKIWFSSASDARAHGYRPCKVCNPP